MNRKYYVEYNNKKIEYSIQRCKIKNIYIKIKSGKVEVRIPNKVTIESVKSIIESRKKWIFDSLEKQNEHEDRQIDLKNKNYIFYLDRKIPVKYYFNNINKISIELTEKTCNVYIPNSMKNEKEFIVKVEKKLIETQKNIALQKVTNAMEKYIKLTGLKPHSYTVRRFKSIWGNCSSKKDIKINQNVIWYSQREIEYVCLHEICHLKYMNHQKLFWDLVKKYMPDYKERIRKFKE